MVHIHPFNPIRVSRMCFSIESSGFTSSASLILFSAAEGSRFARKPKLSQPGMLPRCVYVYIHRRESFL